MSHTTIVTPERVCGDPITGSFGPDTVIPSENSAERERGRCERSEPGGGVAWV
jgi:hypothetical protein